MESSVMQPARMWLNGMEIRPNIGVTPTPMSVAIAPVTVSAGLVRIDPPEGQLPAIQCNIIVRIRDDIASVELPYRGDIAASGIFVGVNLEASEYSTLKRLVSYNGLAMLYGLARDAIFVFTSQCLPGPFYLPAVNLTDIGKDLFEGKEQSIAAPVGEAGAPPPTDAAVRGDRARRRRTGHRA